MQVNRTPKRNWRRVVITTLVVCAVAPFLTACDNKVAAASDEVVCVYSKHPETGGQLIKQIMPGESFDFDTVQDKNGNSIDTRNASQAEVVRIPDSHRFHFASKDDNKRDALAEKFYPFSAMGTNMELQGQLRFRFNKTLACEWYTRHGRRNLSGQPDLGFNQRGPGAANYGWFKFLAENQGAAVSANVQKIGGKYAWYALKFNYQIGTDEFGNPKKGETPGAYSLDQFGLDLGDAVDAQLTSSLGGRYFCGVDPARTAAIDEAKFKKGDVDRKTCTTITFDVAPPLDPTDMTLVASREKTNALQEKLRASDAESTLLEKQAANVAMTEGLKQKILAEEIKTAQLRNQVARLTAEADAQDCLVLAQQGLDCDGNRPPIYINGQPAAGK